jgi:UDP-N-acetylmuramyl pentapeptide synthase
VLANPDWEPIAEALCKRVAAGDQILVKGSRAMRMERIVERLTANGGSA